MITIYLGAFSLVIVLLSLTYMIYLLYAMWSAAPFVPTPKQHARTMLAVARIQPGECVIDIGSGDGRLVFAAAAAGAQASGVEINPILYAWSVLKTKAQRLPRVTFRRENLWHVNITHADVLMIYCLPDKMRLLEKKAMEEMKPGARVVVYAFPFPDWQYAEKNGKVYLYKIPNFKKHDTAIMSLTPIGDALSHHLAKGALRVQVTAAQVLEFAQEALIELLGQELAHHAKPLFLKNRTLTISCSSSSVAQEIRLKQSQIVEYVNQKLGGKEVDRIRYLA